MTRRYLIIGTGPAAIAAAESIQNEDTSGQVTLIGEEAYGFYSRPGLAYYINQEIRGRNLLLEHGRQLWRIRGTVTSIDRPGHQVALADRSSYTYDRLLIATGCQATKLLVPGADLSGVFKLDDMDDARRIIKLASRNKTAVVTGGGITALEIVEAMVSHGVKTHYVFRGSRYWHNVLDEVESAAVETRLKNQGVRLYPSSQVAQILGKRGKVSGAETEKGLCISCQIVGVAIGVQPRLELAISAGLKTDKGIITDEYLQTSAADIYAAGDVAQVFDPISGKYTLETLWSKALAQGRTAGRNMAGTHTPYTKGVPFNVTRLAGLTTTIIGAVGTGNDGQVFSISRGESETWRYPPNVIAVQRDFEFNRTRIMLGAKNILGAVVMGDQTLSRPLQQLITQKVDITPIRAQLIASQALVADIIVEFWSAWSGSHEAK